jgi:diaminopimelate epimerase
VAYPSGNMTAIVFDDSRRQDLRELNERIMKTWSQENPDKPQIEQCCFITTPKNDDAIARVEMFGGEFCGNALRNAVKVLSGESNSKGIIKVFGLDDPLKYQLNG